LLSSRFFSATLDYPQLGGEQELKRRAGTENLAQIVGMAKALQLHGVSILVHRQVEDNLM
jgi:cysteine sulfinate desulfinase/cysteine desulfurase-like protein